jgi:DNA-binding Lrp family transcriptional regulator
MALDEIDSRILDALQHDGRLSNKELAARAGLSPSACLARVRSLERSGTIRGYRAEVDPRALGIHLMALVAVRLSGHSPESLSGLSDSLRARKEVVAIYYVSGGDDFLVHVAARDSDHLRDLLPTLFTARHDVSHVETSLVFEHFRSGVLPNYAEVVTG